MDIASQMMSVFAGLERAYGTYTISATKSNGKRTGQATMPREPVTVELWQHHLDGKKGLGIVPIRDDATVMFGAIDVDSYEINHIKLISKMEQAGLPFVVCRSKSGGAHCFLFCSEPVAASTMRERLREIIEFLGLPPTTEIFPKQSQLASEQDCGSFINMPYFDGLKGMRYAIRPNGDAMGAEDFLAYVATRRMGAEWFEAELLLTPPDPEPGAASSSADAYCLDGPPCLETIAKTGAGEGARNEVLTNFARYAKRKHGKNWKKETALFNERVMQPPLEHGEVEQVCGSVGRKDYYYSCKAPCLSVVCDATLCRTRQFGILPATDVGKFGELRKLLTDPPIFFLDVIQGDTTLTMELTAEQLQSPRLFQRRCMEIANIVPPIAKQEDWTRVIADWLNRVQPIQAPADASLEGQCWELVERYCTGRARGVTPDELMVGKPWIHENGVTFRLQDLMKFLTINGFKDFKPNKVAALLQKKGYDGKFGTTVVRGRAIMTWTVPAFHEPVSDLPVPEVEEKPY